MSRFMPCRKPLHFETNNIDFQNLSSYICENELRNKMIVNDIKELLKNKRKILLLSDRIKHLEILEELLKDEANLILLHGGMKSKERKKLINKINNLNENDEILIMSSAKLVGEGFDLPYLDTLILASPISWKGRVIQYVGRLHRET